MSNNKNKGKRKIQDSVTSNPDIVQFPGKGIINKQNSTMNGIYFFKHELSIVDKALKLFHDLITEGEYKKSLSPKDVEDLIVDAMEIIAIKQMQLLSMVEAADPDTSAHLQDDGSASIKKEKKHIIQ